jgi:putative DNA primase/helicase
MSAAHAASESWVARAKAVRILDELRRRGVTLHRQGRKDCGEFAGPCPQCGGTDRFSVNTKKEVWNCRGCGKGGDIIDLVMHLDDVGFDAACARLTGSPRPKRNGKDSEPHKVVAEEYPYRNPSGDVVLVKERVEFLNADGTFVLAADGKREKTFRVRQPDAKGGWRWVAKGVPIYPYRLPQLTEAIATEHFVLVVEGERKCDLLAKWNVIATCCCGGAKKWRPEHSAFLRGADVVILPDNDQPGREHADAVAASLQGIAARVRLLDLPGLPPQGDIVDWAAAGGTVERLHALIEYQAKPWSPGATPDALRAPELSDEALALQFAERHAAALRYVAAWSRWLSFDGRRWHFDDTLLAFDRSRQICREAAASCKRKLAPQLASAKTVAAIERLSKADRRLAATVDQWDANLFALNTHAGVVDLHTGKLRPHRAEDYHTKITTVAPDQTCPIPLWNTVIKRAVGEDQTFADYLQRLFGYALTGSTREHSLHFAYGTGANSKGTIIGTVASVLGDYHKAAPIETFTAADLDRHPTDLADLHGARMVTATETEEGRRWAESRIKTLTGGDRVKARFMRQDFFEYMPQFTLIIQGNHKPGLRAVDEAIRRRFHLIPFLITIPPEERDLELTDKLKAEWSGILHWCIEGCLEWQRRGLDPPDCVKAATAAYLEMQDAVSTWIDERCVRDRKARECTADLFADWSAWAKQSGEYSGSRRNFSDRLESRGFSRYRTMAERGFAGLRLLNPPGNK